MEYKTLGELAGEAEIRLEPMLASPPMTKRERLERWVMLLEREPGGSCPRSRKSNTARPASSMPNGRTTRRSRWRSPTPCCAHCLNSDRVGTAAALFELSHWEIHQLVCSCRYGRSMAAGTAAMRVRALARRSEPLTLSRPGFIATGLSAAAVGLLIAIL